MLSTSEIFVLSSREMGHPAFASAAAFSTAALSALGTLAVDSRRLSVTAKPLSVFSNVTEQVVLIHSGFRLALPSSAENAMEKHEECAAAMSSSGLVPGAFSKRCVHEYGIFLNTPLSEVNVPLPLLRSPFHWAEA